MHTQPEIRTSRLLLRSLRDSDREAFAAMNVDARVMEHYQARLSRDESDALLDRVRAGAAEHGFGVWAVEIPDEVPFIGFVGIHRQDFAAAFTPCVEVAWRLAAAHWGKGYATEAALASVNYGFEQLELEEILSWTTPQNRRSRRVMEKLGMTHDPAADFDHPRIPEGHPLQRQVLYRLPRSEFQLA